MDPPRKPEARVRHQRLPIEDTAAVKIGARDVKLTNLDKVYFPALGRTKGDLVDYYVDVAGCVLHHVRCRPMHMR
jgi:DNA primase